MDALQQLRDLHLPPPPDWWPPAPGWWLLMFMTGATVIWLIWRYRLRRQRRRPYRYARGELARLAGDCRAGRLDSAAFAEAANGLLKRLLIHALNRPDLAALGGAPWLAAVEAHITDEQSREVFRRGFGTARYQPAFDTDVDALEPVVRSVIRHLEVAAA